MSGLRTGLPASAIAAAMLLPTPARAEPTPAAEPFLRAGFPDATLDSVDVPGATIGYRRLGGGDETVVLLPGWPENGYAWRKVARGLATDFDVVVPDARGTCGSSVPADGYDKATMAADVAGLLDALSIERAHVVGHDVGMMVAWFFATSFPARTASLTMVEGVLPGTAAVAELMSTGALWHFGLNADVDLADALVRSDERAYLDHFHDTAAASPAAIGEEERAFYLDCYTRPGVLRASFETYAALAEDAVEVRARLSNGPPDVRTLFVAGSASLGPSAPSIAGELAVSPRIEIVEGSGHFVPVEAPRALESLLRSFLSPP